MRKLFLTVAASEEWAESLGISVDYGGRLDLANLASEMLQHLAERSLPFPDEIAVSRISFQQRESQSVDVPASSREGRITINPDAVFWINPVAFASILRRQRFWSSASPLHALYHEAGHVVHFKADVERYGSLSETDLTPRQKTLAAGEVSSRAHENIYEFLSEVFAGMMAGESYSSRIRNLYRKYGGIEP